MGFWWKKKEKNLYQKKLMRRVVAAGNNQKIGNDAWLTRTPTQRNDSGSCRYFRL